MSPPWAAVVLAVNLLTAGLTAVHVAARFFPDADDGLDRLLVALLSAVVEIVAVLTVLGWFGRIYIGSVTALHIALYALARWRLPLPAATRRTTWHAARTWPLVIIGAAVLAVVVAYAAGPYSIEPDTMRYHMVNAVHWLQTHGITSLPFAEPGDPSAEQPGNGELVGLWLMLPTHDDTLAYLGNVVMAVVCLLSAAVAAKRIGVDARVAALVAAAAMLTPIVVLSQLRSMSTDIVGAAMLTATLALGLALRGQRPHVARTALVGAALGIAMGTKYIDIPPAIAVGVAIMATWRKQWRRRDFAVLAGTAVAFAATWYVRDWVLAGNPLYPVHLAVAGVTIFPGVRVDIYRHLTTPLAVHVARGHWAQADAWLRVAVTALGPALLIALAGIVARRPAHRDGAVTLLRRLTIVLLLLYTATPFTGGGDAANTFQLGGAMRFLLPALLVGALLFAATLPARMSVPLALLVLAYDVAKSASVGRADLQLNLARVGAGMAIAAIVVALVAVMTVPTLRSTRRTIAASLAAVTVAGTALAAAVIAALHPGDRPTLLDSARRMIGRPDAAVVVVNVFDARQLFGPHLDIPLTAVGDGPVGRQMPIQDAAAFTRAVEAEAPVVVAVSEDGTPDIRPAGWQPPATWRHVGTQLDADVYVVEPSG